MTLPNTSSSSHPEAGFALIVLLSVVGIGSVGVLLAVQALVPPLAQRQEVADRNLGIVAQAAMDAYRLDGSFPGDLDALQARGVVRHGGNWRRDPLGAGEELDYGLSAGALRIRSRGADGVLGTADDRERTLSEDTQMRVRQRGRLRLLRAVLTRSAYRLDGLMTPSEQLSMRDAMRDYAIAKRRWLTASASERATLTVTMTSAAATITGLAGSYGLPALPVTITGAGGLMSQLGLSETRAFDGSGAALQRDPMLGWIAVGADGTGGTDDDM